MKKQLFFISLIYTIAINSADRQIVVKKDPVRPDFSLRQELLPPHNVDSTAPPFFVKNPILQALLDKQLDVMIQEINDNEDVKKELNKPEVMSKICLDMGQSFQSGADYVAKKLAAHLPSAQDFYNTQYINLRGRNISEIIKELTQRPNFNPNATYAQSNYNLAELTFYGEYQGLDALLSCNNGNPLNIYSNYGYESSWCLNILYMLTIPAETLKKLIDRMDVNTRGINGDTPFLYTMKEPVYREYVASILAICRLLKDRGSDPKLANNDGITPYKRAVQTGFPALIEFFAPHK